MKFMIQRYRPIIRLKPNHRTVEHSPPTLPPRCNFITEAQLPFTWYIIATFYQEIIRYAKGHKTHFEETKHQNQSQI